MSLINLGEVYYRSVKAKIAEPPETVLVRMHQLPVEYVEVTERQVYAAARLKAVHAIAYADAFAVALSIGLNAPLITGDPELSRLASAGILQLHWVGR
jgi:predicted nucleic acid-binding protein